MRIKMVEDFGPPIAVTAVDLLTEEFVPQYNEWASYIMAAGGYVAGMMGFGGQFVMNMGMAALPLAARNIRDRVKSGMTGKVAGSRMSFRPAMSGRVSQTVFPEYESARIA